jgi:hypothetical protein
VIFKGVACQRSGLATCPDHPGKHAWGFAECVECPYCHQQMTLEYYNEWHQPWSKCQSIGFAPLKRLYQAIISFLL